MTALVKYKKPVEYSFYVWIKNHPQSGHPLDTERFLVFVKTVCAFNAKRWKDSKYLEERILKEIPRFDEKRLQSILSDYEYIIDFYRARPLPKVWGFENGVNCKRGYYIERSVKNGEFIDTQLPINKLPRNVRNK